jgi:hypothetical protein
MFAQAVSVKNSIEVEKSAEASFSILDGCNVTYVEVYVFETMRPAPGRTGTESEVTVSIEDFDECTGEQRISAFGAKTLSSSEFFVRKNLSRAKLNVDLEAHEYSREIRIPLSLTVVWKADGPLERSAESSIKESSIYLFRPATAECSLTADGSDIVLEPAYYAAIKWLTTIRMGKTSN